MWRSCSASTVPANHDWADTISKLRRRLNLSQTAFGQRLHCSAMAVSRWERGAQEPPAGSYIELGNLAGNPLCWTFWGRAGLRNEDLMRVLPRFRRRIRHAGLIDFQFARAGAGKKKSKAPPLVAIPLLKVVAASDGKKGDSADVLHEAPVESVIAAPRTWCPNPSATSCLRVHGDSMAPLIHHGYILAVDSSQNDPSKLNGKVVIAWNKDMGLTVSRLKRYQDTEVLQPENAKYEAIVLDKKHAGKILARVLWWIGRAP